VYIYKTGVINRTNYSKMAKNIFLILLISISFFGCGKEDTLTTKKELPSITTLSATNISSTSATSGGTILSNGNDSITAFGICWAITPEPTTANPHNIDTGNRTTFSYTIKGLGKNQAYYVRAYATNSVGTNYGNQITFKTDSTEHIYVSGISNGRSVYWKDGVLNPLTNSGTFNFALGSSITVSNNDVYVAGYELLSGSSFYEAKIWKNGIGTTVGGLQSFARAVSVVNNDVYAVGTENYAGSSYAAKFWKNGVATTLSTSGTTANLSSIFVVNNNVYVGGHEESGVNRKGIVWVNGTPTRLFGFCFPSGNGLCTWDWTTINDIYVVGNDVYAVGTSVASTGNYDNIIWKNGVATQINIIPNSIFINNNDIYIAGTVGNAACVWKNGTITALTNGINQAFATSIYVLGNDVYVAGSERVSGTTNSIAKIWKNGTVLNLSDGTVYAEATDIFVQ
jgi:hypothetical protein